MYNVHETRAKVLCWSVPSCLNRKQKNLFRIYSLAFSSVGRISFITSGAEAESLFTFSLCVGYKNAQFRLRIETGAIIVESATYSFFFATKTLSLVPFPRNKDDNSLKLSSSARKKLSHKATLFSLLNVTICTDRHMYMYTEGNS